MPLFKQILIPSSFQVLPFSFDVIVAISPIRFLLVDENTKAVVSFNPLTMVLHYNFLSFFDKAFLTNPFDEFSFVLHTQKLLNLQLYRQTLAVPASPERHVISLHGF